MVLPRRTSRKAGFTAGHLHRTIFWVFFLLTAFSLFVLRERDKDIERPFKVPLYPKSR